MFDPVDPKVNFVDLEKKLLDKWYKEGTVQKYLDKNKKSSKYFSFIDGPITANNPMAVHHGWGRTYKDVWQRYKNMQGFKQRFQNGFDCQGLWVEVEVEKELGLRSKKDIENLVPGDPKASIAKFVELCKDRVKKYSDIQTDQSKRLAYFMDWDHSYFTLSDENNYMIWHFLKKCHEKGLIYKGHDVVAWCPRCETAISEHEILTENYKEVVHDSVYFELPIKDRKGEFLLVWTTTPWTIPANIAVSVDEKLNYTLVEGFTGDKFYIAADLVEVVFKGKHKVIKTIKGKDLVGLKYTSPFDHLPVIAEALQKYPETMHVVVATDDQLMPITTTEGTGLVHTSTGTGQEDFKLGKKLGLPVIAAIDDTAAYLEGFGELSGKNAKKHPELILDFMKDKWVFEIVPYKHKYPACWRCKTELVWKIADEWYILIDPIREEMKKVTKKINWLPEFGLKRELDWLSNMHDWMISKKNRYWGLALPIWECEKCGTFEIMGSKEELEKRAVKGWEEFSGHTPHKPWIDDVLINCSKCGEEVHRVPDVGNPWLDAGIVPFSTISAENKSEPLYLKNKEEWRKWFPADFITESFPGQFKNWFYSMIAMSAVLEKENPFSNVLGYATCVGEDGRAMHKSWGNSIEFNEAADKIGVDVMRWMYVRQNPANNLAFGYHIADETRRSFHLRLWNVYNYFITYANIDGWKKDSKNSNNMLDQWIGEILNLTVVGVTEALDKYDAFTASGLINNLVDDLSLWYIRRSRDRVGADREAFYDTCYEILVTLSKLLAPFTPFIAETMYRNLTKAESVHLADWSTPDLKVKIKNPKLIRDMKAIRDLAEKIHAARKEAQIAVKQPLASVEVVSEQKYEFSDELLQILKDEVNIKKIIFRKGEGKVVLDTKITPELEEEAKTRDLIRQIQEERKRLGLSLSQQAKIISPWLPKKEDLLTRLKTKTLASELEIGEKLEVK